MKSFFVFLFVAVLFLPALHFAFGSDNVVLSGKGLPNQSTGVNGDFYMDSATGNYYLKSNNAWISSTKSDALGVLQQVPALKSVTNSSINSTVNSQGGILTNSPSSNFIQHSTPYCFRGTVSVLGFCVDYKGNVLYSQHAAPLQSSNVFCSTGLQNSKGYCINGANSQGGILGSPIPNTHSSAFFCSTGLVNARGLCMNSINSENSIFPPTHSTSPAFSSSQNYYSAPYNTQGSFGNPDVTRSQIFTIPGMNSPNPSNLPVNSQGGLYGHN